MHFQIFEDFLGIFVIDFQFNSMWSENMFCMTRMFSKLLELVLWPRILVNVLCTLEKNVYSGVVTWHGLYLLIRSSCLIVFISTIFFLMFCLFVLSSIEKGTY